MRIGVDVDEVLAEMMKPLLTKLNRAYGKNISFEEVHSFSLEDVFGCTRDEVKKTFRDYVGTKEFSKTMTVRGSLEGATALTENGHELIAISARPHYLEGQTVCWLSINYPNLFSQMYLTDQFENPNGLSKSGLCKKLGVKVMIEDSPHYAIECAEIGTQVLLLDCPWNRSMPPRPNIKRVYSWNEIVENIK